jgi:hypothetical protein
MQECGPKRLHADIGSLKRFEVHRVWLAKKLSGNNILIRPLDNLYDWRARRDLDKNSFESKE